MDMVGLGLATLDVLIRLRPRPGDEPELCDFLLEGGGPVATAMAAASKLGARAGFVGTAGADFAGDAKLLSLSRYGVDVSRVVRRDGPERQVILVSVDAETGERSFRSLSGERWELLRPEELDRDYVTSAPYLHLDGAHLGAGLAAARWVHEAGGRVVFDAATTAGRVRDAVRELIGQVDVLICGSGFAEALTGEDDVEAACRAARRLGPDVVVQTEGAEGSLSAGPAGAFHAPAFAVDVVDTTGAGDVFHGAYIVGLLRGWELRSVAAFASAAAAMKCTAFGGRAGVGTLEETLEFCRRRGVQIAG